MWNSKSWLERSQLLTGGEGMVFCEILRAALPVCLLVFGLLCSFDGKVGEAWLFLNGLLFAGESDLSVCLAVFGICSPMMGGRVE